MRYPFSISRVLGKNLRVADILSRAPISKPANTDKTLQENAAAYVGVVLSGIPATEEKDAEIKSHQQQDNADNSWNTAKVHSQGRWISVVKFTHCTALLHSCQSRMACYLEEAAWWSPKHCKRRFSGKPMLATWKLNVWRGHANECGGLAYQSS